MTNDIFVAFWTGACVGLIVGIVFSAIFSAIANSIDRRDNQ